MKERRLTQEEWQAAVERSQSNDAHRAIARSVLVDGRSQKAVGTEYQLTAGAVSQIIGKVWRAHLLITQGLPDGWREVTVALPEREATLVEALARMARSTPELR